MAVQLQEGVRGMTVEEYVLDQVEAGLYGFDLMDSKEVITFVLAARDDYYLFRVADLLHRQ